jgi:hypothetical protein
MSNKIKKDIYTIVSYDITRKKKGEEHMRQIALLLGAFLIMLVGACAAEDGNTTSPIDAFGAVEDASLDNSTTTPTSTAFADSILQPGAATIKSGVATAYWVELIPYPTAARRLSLIVNGSPDYQTLNSPSDSNLASVQEAFCNPDKLQVLAWYNPAVNRIVGLVVRSL